MTYPLHDSLPEPPTDYESIPLGAGQEPNAYGGPDSFQFDTAGDVSTPDRSLVRRNPDETFVFISRPPERW